MDERENREPGGDDDDRSRDRAGGDDEAIEVPAPKVLKGSISIKY